MPEQYLLLGVFSGGNPIQTGYQYTFNAKNSNPIYGNSITVQPHSITVVMWQRTQ